DERQAVLLPGGTAGVSAEGFAVSSGTRYPELSYALAAYLTTLPELTSLNFLSASPARQSFANSDTTTNNQTNGAPGGGPNGGGPGGGFNNAANISDAMQAVVDQALYAAFSGAEVRYGSYLDTIVSQINSDGVDAHTVLPEVEASAISDVQTAAALSGTTSVVVALPPEEVTIAPGQIVLNCAVNTGFGMGPNSQLANEDTWQQVIDTFVTSDPDVGYVNLEAVNQSDLAALASEYDCFILPTNAVSGSDVSPLLNLDPLLSTDASFDRNDLLTGVLPQVQQNNMTWALPLALSPQTLRYTPDLLARAGVPEPVNGWTTDTFIDALRQLMAVVDADTAPFTPNDPTGSYLLQLIGAFGGLPIDYRTDPVTINFTDPTNVAAIQQVLDLAVQGYMEYSSVANIGQGGGFSVRIDSTAIPITTDVLSGLARGFGRGAQALANNNGVQTLYPQNTRGAGFVAFDITTGYISATAQNPEAAYRFLSLAAQYPALFSGMPVRRSLINDPTVAASQGADVIAIYSQLETLLQNPNTVIFPANSGLGGIATNFITEYWLKAAFDAYVLDGADLLSQLQDAEVTTLAYLECVATTQAADLVAGEDMMGGFGAMMDCAQAVDPTLNLGF
ncbi:MAG: extracellular solute-binding protein, partial [Anaerolineae bacterium]|nr:extracellular solute-binding protein [Anaerolineae bacterium]